MFVSQYTLMPIFLCFKDPARFLLEKNLPASSVNNTAHSDELFAVYRKSCFIMYNIVTFYVAWWCF